MITIALLYWLLGLSTLTVLTCLFILWDAAQNEPIDPPDSHNFPAETSQHD